MHACSDCGHEDSARIPPALCPSCGALDSFEVRTLETRVELVRADALPEEDFVRRPVGSSDVDAMLLGGFAAGTTVLLHGRDGSGKTRCALRWATAIGPTLCLALEMRARMTRYTAESAGADLSQLYLADDTQDWRAKAEAAGALSVVLDSISVVETDHEQRRITRELEHWARETDGHVFVVCHNTKGGKYHGPSWIGHWPDVRIQAYPKPGGICRVAVKKSRTCPVGSCEATIIKG